jgi:hypothetical protein
VGSGRDQAPMALEHLGARLCPPYNVIRFQPNPL